MTFVRSSRRPAVAESPRARPLHHAHPGKVTRLSLPLFTPLPPQKSDCFGLPAAGALWSANMMCSSSASARTWLAWTATECKTRGCDAANHGWYFAPSPTTFRLLPVKCAHVSRRPLVLRLGPMNMS